MHLGFFGCEIYCYSARFCTISLNFFFLLNTYTFTVHAERFRRPTASHFATSCTTDTQAAPDNDKSSGLTNLFIDPLRHKFIHWVTCRPGISVFPFYCYGTIQALVSENGTAKKIF